MKFARTFIRSSFSSAFPPNRNLGSAIFPVGSLKSPLTEVPDDDFAARPPGLLAGQERGQGVELLVPPFVERVVVALGAVQPGCPGSRGPPPGRIRGAPLPPDKTRADTRARDRPGSSPGHRASRRRSGSTACPSSACRGATPGTSARGGARSRAGLSRICRGRGFSRSPKNALLKRFDQNSAKRSSSSRRSTIRARLPGVPSATNAGVSAADGTPSIRSLKTRLRKVSSSTIGASGRPVSPDLSGRP